MQPLDLADASALFAFLTSASPLQWLIAFVALCVTDICWAFYVNAAAQSPVRAAGWAVALFVLGGVAVVGYTANPVLLLPSSIGAFVGTYIGVLKSRKATACAEVT